MFFDVVSFRKNFRGLQSDVSIIETGCISIYLHQTCIHDDIYIICQKIFKASFRHSLTIFVFCREARSSIDHELCLIGLSLD